jgi:hypothetical protein
LTLSFTLQGIGQVGIGRIELLGALCLTDQL